MGDQFAGPRASCIAGVRTSTVFETDGVPQLWHCPVSAFAGGGHRT